MGKKVKPIEPSLFDRLAEALPPASTRLFPIGAAEIMASPEKRELVAAIDEAKNNQLGEIILRIHALLEQNKFASAQAHCRSAIEKMGLNEGATP